MTWLWLGGPLQIQWNIAIQYEVAKVLLQPCPPPGERAGNSSLTWKWRVFYLLMIFDHLASPSQQAGWEVYLQKEAREAFQLGLLKTFHPQICITSVFPRVNFTLTFFTRAGSHAMWHLSNGSYRFNGQWDIESADGLLAEQLSFLIS